MLLSVLVTGRAAEDKKEEEEHQKEAHVCGGASKTLSGQFTRAPPGLRKQHGRPRVQHWTGQACEWSAHGPGSLPQPETALHVISQQ